MDKKINSEYIGLGKELFLLWRAKYLPKKIQQKSKKILVVNPCLIGDFVAGIFAIREFIIKHPDFTVDLVVSPPLALLASRIIGINAVFTPKNISQATESYAEIIVMRTNIETNNALKNIKTSKIRTSFLTLVIYGIHLLKNLILAKKPKQWREVNSEILRVRPNNLKFDDLFRIKNDDYKKIENQEFLKREGKKIIIHTSCLWPMKKWKMDKWAELLERINQNGKFIFIFAGASADQADFDYLNSKLNFNLYNTAGLDLFDLMLMMKKCDLLIGIDSGPRNLAHLAGLRSITIFGPGPHLFYPLNNEDVMIDKTKGRGVFQMYFISSKPFIDKITVDEVYKYFLSLTNYQ